MAPKRIPLHEAAPTHDEYFQENFADPVAAAGLVRLVAPPALIDALELEKLTPLPTAQFDADLGKRIPDLLFECPSRSGRVVVSILFEHKSSPDYQIALKFLRYMLLDHEKRHADSPAQPALVLPILVYHGRRSWKPNLGLVHERYVVEALHPFILRVPALIVDLNKIADDTIETIEGLDAHTRATLLAMKHIFENDPDILVFLGKLSVRIQAMPREQQKRFLERTILYLNYSGSVKSQDARILLENYPEDEDPMRFKTGYQKDMEESFQLGEAKGIEQGIEQGIERGLTLEKIEVIQNLLAKGLDWNFIQSVTHIDQAGFEALFQKHAK